MGKQMLFTSTVAMSTFAIANALVISTVQIKGSGVDSVNQDFQSTSAKNIPPGFENVCIKNQWDVQRTWETLNNGTPWFRASNDAYIYLNSVDNKWWIDRPDGNGVYIASKNQGEEFSNIPPKTGWEALSVSYNPTPSLEFLSINGKR